MSLEIFSSRGEALHPESAEDDSKMQSYFDQHILSFGTTEQEFIIESYLKVKTEVRKEQVSLRYRTDSENPLRACQTALTDQLVEGRGWEIREPYGNRPGILPWKVLWERDQPTLNEQDHLDLYTDTEGLSLSATEAQLLHELGVDDNHTIRITTNDYETISQTVPYFIGTDYTVVISRQNHAPPDYADIHFSIDGDQWDKYEIHQETQEKLNQLKQKRRVAQREETLDDLQTTLEKLTELNTEQATVSDQLRTALNMSYPELTVIEEAKLTKLQREARQPAPSSPTTTQGGNLMKPNPVNRRLVLIAIIVIVILAVGIFGLFLLGPSMPSLGF